MCKTPIYTIATGDMPLKCGKCIECCKEHAEVWAMRCMDEASLHDKNCCLTLTYADTDGNLHKDHLQKFIKRLRYYVEPLKIRYYGCGEYGGLKNRPHYHLIIFGWCPDDMIYRFTKKSIKYYKSKMLEDIWGYGFVDVSELSLKACKYCAKYLSKLDRREHEVQPFTVMSRRPGIGADSVKDEYILTGERYYQGKKYQIPKYYLDKLEQKGYNVDMIKQRRRYVATQVASEYLDYHKCAYQKYLHDLELKRLRGGKY